MTSPPRDHAARPCRVASRHPALLVLLALLASTTMVRADEPRVLATSSGEHLWFIVPPAGDEAGVDLCHHARAMGGPYARPLTRLPRAPEAITAWGNRLWLVYAPRGAAGEREVFSVEVQVHPMTGGYFLVPHDRLDIAPPLPGGGDLLALAATERGPIALVAAAPGDEGGAPRVRRRLVRLGPTGWEPVEAPAGFERATGMARMAAAGARGERLFVLDGSPAGGSRLFVRASDGSWSSPRTQADHRAVRDLVRVGAGAVAAIIAGDEAPVTVAYLRAGEMLPFATVARPAGPWTAVGLTDGVGIVTGARFGDLSLRLVTAPAGTVGEPAVLTTQPVDPLDRLRLPVLFGIAVFAIALIVFLRPVDPRPLVLPAGLMLLGPGGRLAAFLLDALAPAILTLVVLGREPASLLGLPLMTPTFEDSVPYLVTAALTMLHSCATELTGRPSLGKALLRSRIIGVHGGERISARRIVVRNAVKTLVVMMPPLAVIAMLSPNLQGLQDLAARTIVVGERADRSDEA